MAEEINIQDKKELEQKIDTPDIINTGTPSTKLYEIEGMLETVTTAPTGDATNFEQQLKIYVDSVSTPAIRKFYYYSDKSHEWVALEPASNFSKVRVRRVAAVNNATSWTRLDFDTEDFDTNSEFDSSTNFRFTAKNAGYYQIYAQYGEIGQQSQGFWVAIYKNGAIYSQGGNSMGLKDFYTGVDTATVSDIVYLAVDDYIEIYTRGDYTNAIYVSAGYQPHLTIQRIS